jgi:hypothetical protein
MSGAILCLHRRITTHCQHCGPLLPAGELQYMEKLKQPRSDLATLIWEDWRYGAYFLALCQEGVEAELRGHAWRFRSGLWERGQQYQVADVADALLKLAGEYAGTVGVF